MSDLEKFASLKGVVSCVDSGLFVESRCFLGGGALGVLTQGGYRDCENLVFFAADIDGFRQLRRMASIAGSLDPLFPGGDTLGELVSRPDLISQTVKVGAGEILVEIRHEQKARRLFKVLNRQLGLEVLDQDSYIAMKLVENARRWATPEAMLRDVIDIAMVMDPKKDPSEKAWEMAREVQGIRVGELFEEARRRVQLPAIRKRLREELGLTEAAEKQVSQVLGVKRRMAPLIPVAQVS